MSKEELYIDCPISMTTIVLNMDDDSLEKLNSIVFAEKAKRFQRRIDSGFYPALNDYELNRSTSEIIATKSYRERTGQDLYTASRIVRIGRK